MKKWQIILASLLAVMIIAATPLTIFAAGKNNAADSIVRPALRGGMAIVAPRFALPGTEISMTVFSRKEQTPVAGAEVWIINRNNVPDFREAIRSLRQKWQGATSADISQSIIELNARKIGETDANGKLMTPVDESGKYLLIAV